MCELPLMYSSHQPGFETEGWVKPAVDHAPFPGYYGISFKNEVEHFVDCVREDTEPLVTGERAKAALKVALCAYQSIKTGKAQKIE
jgi:predicted dehydrogenase